MIDVQSLFESVKAAWVVRLHNAKDSEIWTTVAKHVLKYDINNSHIFKLNFSCMNTVRFLKKIPLFYQEMLIAYNKSKCVTKDVFCKTILEQSIWANEHITIKPNARITETLYFKNWIDCNIVKISNLKFKDGILDVNHMMQIIRNKANIYAETVKLCNALLKPYKMYLGDHHPDNNTDMCLFFKNGKPMYSLISPKSKIFYDNLVTLKAKSPLMERHWTNVLNCETINFKTMYLENIYFIKDKKLSEFNFKMMNYILPCNVNLYHWKKSITKMCNICNREESIEHLLYQCNYAQSIWNDFSRITGIAITLKSIITGYNLDNT